MFSIFLYLTFVRFVFILVSIMLDRMEGYRGGESEIEMESLTKEDRVFDLSRDNREITRGGKEGEERAI